MRSAQDQYLNAVHGLGHLIAGRSGATLDWQDPRLLGWSNLLATAVWPALGSDVRTEHSDALEGFSVAHALNTDRNAKILAQLTRVTTRLQEAGIEPLVLKGGAHLATDLWPTPGSRLVSDIDLLIEPAALDQAFDVLEDYAGLGPQDRGHPEVNALHKHMMPIVGAGGPGAVELHHSMYARGAAKLAPNAQLRERRRSVRLGAGEILVLSPTDRVLTAMMHGPAGNGTWWVPTLQMRDMLDIHFLEAAHGDDIDWDWIQHHLASHNWAVACEITNSCLERFTGMPPPFRRAGRLARLDGARWAWQVERDSRLLRQAGAAGNHLVFTVGSLRSGGEPRRRILEKLTRKDTYLSLYRRYVFGREA